MKKTKATSATLGLPVWDLPIRLFHWLLVVLFSFSWWSAETGRIDWHFWSGYAVQTALLFRLLWGFAGGSTARFRNFISGPRRLLSYLASNGSWRWIGHTPLGALSVVAMLTLLIGLIGLGLIAIDKDGLYAGPLAGLVEVEVSDAARELHELLFNITLGFIALHIGAIAYYRLVKRKRLVRAMISGRGDFPHGTAPMRAAPAWRAVVCLAIALAATRWIIVGAPPFGP